MRNRFVPVALLAVVVLPLSSCSDDVLTQKARQVISDLRGTAWEPNNGTTKACPDFQDGNHWGVFYPPGYYHPGVANYTVCFSYALPRESWHHGTVALHEAGHLYFQRLRERGLRDVQPRSVEERWADCFSKIFGGQSVGLNYGCYASDENAVRDLLARFPETGGW